MERHVFAIGQVRRCSRVSPDRLADDTVITIDRRAVDRSSNRSP